LTASTCILAWGARQQLYFHPCRNLNFLKKDLALTFAHNFLTQNLYINCFAPPPCLLRSSSNSSQSFIQISYSRHVTLRETKSHFNLSYMSLEYLLPFVSLTTPKLCYCIPFATGWTVRGSDPGGGEILLTRPHRPWGPPNPFNWYRISFSGVKRLGRGVDHPPKSSAKVKERVQLYLFSPSGSSWPILG